jgi:hypothetical protein
MALVISLIAAACVGAFLASCAPEKAAKKNNGRQPAEPLYYDQSMFGYGFGTSLWNYIGGQWKQSDADPFGAAPVAYGGAAFQNSDYGFVWTEQLLFRYKSGSWSNATPSDMPAGTIVDGVFDVNGGCWIAVTNTSSLNGWLVYIKPDGSDTVVAGQGLFSNNPVAFISVFVVAGDNTGIHALAALDGNFEHLRWDGANVSNEIVIPISYNQSTGDDDASPSPPQLAAAVVGMRAAPSGQIWAIGWDTSDKYGRGVFWQRQTNPVSWTRIPTTPNNGCVTTTVYRIAFGSEDGAGYALGGCSHSQIYWQSGPNQWQEMSAPGSESGGYLLQDMAILSATHGWIVGYDAVHNLPLLLVASAQGFQLANPATSGTGAKMNAVVMFSSKPTAVGDDDFSPADDDTSPDDDASPAGATSAGD